MKKFQKHRKTGEKRVIKTTIPARSFFNIYQERKVPDEYFDRDPDDQDEEIENQLDDMEEARMSSVILFDLYTKDGLREYLGLQDEIYEKLEKEEYGDEEY